MGTSGSYYSDGTESEYSEDAAPNNQYGQSSQYGANQQWNGQQQQQAQQQYGANYNQQYGHNQYQQPAMQQNMQQHRQMYLKPTAQQQQSNHSKEEKSAENNPWISAEEAKSRVIVRDTLKRYWQIGAAQSFKLDAWAKQNYAMAQHKKGLFGKKQQSIADILSFADFGKLKCPLNSAAFNDKKLKVQCMQTWKNINSYMGIRKTGKASEGHVEKLSQKYQSLLF